jgi:hypothetical protein
MTSKMPNPHYIPGKFYHFFIKKKIKFNIKKKSSLFLKLNLKKIIFIKII